MLFTPEFLFGSVTHITPAFLQGQGIAALVLDVDNTLTSHNSQSLAPEVASWLAQMRAAGIQLMIASNNSQARVQPFAAHLGLDFVAMSCKPLTLGLARARRRFGVKRSQMAIVGDQLFTDRAAGAFYGIKALVVLPRNEDFHRGILFKRRLEAPFLARYYKKGGKLL